MVTLEGVWNCTQCGQVGISGRATSCSACGSSHDVNDLNEKWYLPKFAKVITDDEGLKLARSGKKWHCPDPCNTENLGTSTACTECNSPRGSKSSSAGKPRRSSSPARRWSPSLTVRKPAVFNPPPEPSWQQPQAVGDDRPTNTPTPYSGLRDTLSQVPNRAKGIALAVLAALGFVGVSVPVYSNFIATETVTVTVESTSWEREVEVEVLRTFDESGWSVPSGARVTGSSREIRSYRDVFDHNETRYRQASEQVWVGSHTEEYACGSQVIDNGNGTFESTTQYCSRQVDDYDTRYYEVPYEEAVYRQEPVYDTRYTYQVDRWETDDWVMASSQDDGPTPVWPTPSVSGGTRRIGDGRRESYEAILVDAEGRKFPAEPDLQDWSELQPGDQLQAEQTRRGRLTEVVWP